MHTGKLLLGETFGAQRVEAVLVGLPAADRPDVADLFAEAPSAAPEGRTSGRV